MTPNRKRITLRLNPELDKRIEKRSSELGISKNALIIIILSKELDCEGLKEVEEQKKAS